MTTYKLLQILMLAAALIVGVTTPVYNGRTVLALVLLAGVLVIARAGRPKPVTATSR